MDIVWLSPIYCSPLADQGYDISDYYNIDPRFGTMDDMDELLAEAKKRDIHIVVYGRTEPYLTQQKNLMAYFRRGDGQNLLVAGNIQKEGQDIPLPGPVKAVLLNNLEEFDVRDGVLRLAPWQFVVLEV